MTRHGNGTADGGEQVTAAAIIIGNEILSGRTADANLNYLARGLTACNIRLQEARVVVDEETAIIEAVTVCRHRYHYVFTTGGIGPTHDDITAAAIAKAFGRPLTVHAEAAARLLAFYGKEHLNEARMRMAYTPEGASLIDNPVSAAPGFRVDNVFVLAGVPSIMQAMFDGVKGGLLGGVPLLSDTVVAYIGESLIANPLAALQARYPELEIGSYPFFRLGKFGTSLVLRGTDPQKMCDAASELAAIITALGVTPLREETSAD